MHKKYTYKGGKKFGPYYYETKRIDGKVVTTYLGNKSPKNKLNYQIVFLVLVSLAFIGSFFLLPLNLTGHVSLDIKSNYKFGEAIDGKLNLNLLEGELIPSNSILLVTYGNISKEFNLSELISEDSVSGEFYAKDTSISGEGDGYGIPGKIKEYPSINFELLIEPSDNKKSGGSNSETTPEPPQQDTSNEQISEPEPSENQQPTEPEQDNSNEQVSEESNSETTSEASEQQDSSITGAVISDNHKINGIVSKDDSFSYELSPDETASLIEGSVSYNDSFLDDNAVDLKIKNDQVIVSTDYFIEKEGFGKEYLGDSVKKISINLDSFGLIADSESTLSISLNYDGENIVKVSKEITISDNINNNTDSIDSNVATNPDSVGSIVNDSGTNETINNSFVNETITANITNVNKTIINESSIEVSTTQYAAVIGKPVKWVKKVSLDSNENLSLIVQIPASADNVSVNKIKGENRPEDSVSSELINSELTVGITGGVTANFESKSSLSKIFDLFRITGNSVNSEDEDVLEIPVELEDSDAGVEIEYYTDAPMATEQNTSSGKTVYVSSPQDVHYEDVLVFTSLPQGSVDDASDILIEWLENNSFLEIYSIEDLDSDGHYDYIEWIAPHLSNQTFNIILINDAQHLDENKQFISNIYPQTKYLDNEWSEVIPSGHYVRVRFERNLTNENDITIYPRIVSGNPKVEVYEKDGNELIAEFNDVVENSYNKVYLENLSGNQDTFDLLILNGDLEFDQIIDPSNSVFTDNFESDLAKWDGNGATAWDLTTTQVHAGSQSILASNGNEGDLISDDIDTSDASSINVSFWFRDDDLDSADIDLYFFNGSTYNRADGSNLIGTFGTEDTWLFYSVDTSSSEYFKSNFRVRINANLGSGENLWIDDFVVNVTTLDLDTTSPSITLNKPIENSTYHIVYDLPFVFNVSLNENGSASYSLDGGETNISMTGNEGTFGTSFNATNDTFTAGDYSVDIYANDTSGNVNSTKNINFSFVRENIILNGTISDSSGAEINTSLVIYDELSSNFIYNSTNTYHQYLVPLNSTYTVEFRPFDINSIDKVVFRDLNFTEINSSVTEIINLDESNNIGNYTTVFAINPQIDNFENATVFFNATSNTLFKCADWIYESQTCNGNWTMFMTDLVVGQVYNFTINPGDPGYGIIEITDAIHLNENRSFISNIYNEAKDLDDIFSETIPDSHFVRVKFQRNLTSENDIMIYPNIISGNPVINVYELDNYTLLEQFNNLENNSYNKIYLTNLTENQDTFDLQVVGGSVQFDHIIDPNITVNGPVFDISVAALNATTFVVAVVNSTNFTYYVKNAIGTSIVGPVLIPATLPTEGSRIKVGAINSTTFAIAWYAGTPQDTTYAVFNVDGTTVTGPTDFDAAVGTVGDPARPIKMSDTYMEFCYFDQVEADADVRLVVIDTWGAGAESPGTGVDGTVTPEATGRNLLSCGALNSTRFIYGFFDDADNDATWVLTNSNGVDTNTISSTTDIDTNVGEDGQIALTTMNGTYFAYTWFTGTRLNYTVRDIDNGVVKATTLLDANASGAGVDPPRLAMATVRNASEPYEWFVTAWNDRNSQIINASVFNATGNLKYNFKLASDQNLTSHLFDIYGRDSLNDFGTCDGTFLFAYQNNTGGTTVRGYEINGNNWDGTCASESSPDVTPPVVTIIRPQNITYTSVPIPFNISTNENSTANYTLNNGVRNYTMTANGSATGFNATNASIANGQYVARYFVWDASGNLNSTTNLTFSVDISGGAGTPGLNVWNSSIDTVWNNATAWSLNRVPIAGDTVVFNATSVRNVRINNNTVAQNLGSLLVDSSYTGTINFSSLFAVGNWRGDSTGTQEWNVTGNINISGGTILIYGDYPYNITAEGHGQIWRSLTGNITIGSGATINGVGKGFGNNAGPCHFGGYGCHAGGSSKWLIDAYGNATAPTSLGSGSEDDGFGYSFGGSAIKLESDNLLVNGIIDVGPARDNCKKNAAGGSIWLKASTMTIGGSLNASGDSAECGYTDTPGGRIRLEYGSSLNFTGSISLGVLGSSEFAGTLTFTNNTWPGDWNLSGNIGLLGGDFGDGDVVNVLGNFNTKGYNLSVFGDCFANAGHAKGSVCFNTTGEGKGVWINSSNVINVTFNSILDGDGTGFPNATGPGIASGIAARQGGTHGGLGGSATVGLYGSEIGTLSLGSGSDDSNGQGKYGGSAIKLQAPKIIVDGKLTFRESTEACLPGGAGGSIWLTGQNISGSGTLDTSTYDISCSSVSGGGGRIAIVATNNLSFSGFVNNSAGNGDNADGGAGTVFIKSDTRIISGMNVSTTSFASGGNITFNDTFIILSGIYNATGATKNGTIIVNYTSCSSDTSSAIFNPDAYISSPDCGSNSAPYNGTFLVMNSTTGTNRTLENINVRTTLLDKDNNNINVTVRWYNNSILHLVQMYNSSYTNGSTFIATLGYGNTTKNENWSVGLVLYDGQTSFNVNSTNITILNSPPIVSLSSPENGSFTINRTNQAFSWSYSDDDGDSIQANAINISLVASSACTDTNFDGSVTYDPGILGSLSLTDLSRVLNCLIDNGDYYKWSVAADDGFGFGPLSAPFNISVQAYLNAVMNISLVEFGSIAYLQSNDTSNNSPKPFILVNEGNVFSNVSIHATNLWSSVANPSSYYTAKADNVTTNGISENGSFNWANSRITYINISPTSTNFITDLNYADSSDSAEIDINVTVPSSEAGGTRTSTITFTITLGPRDYLYD